jgi:trigger factor
MAALRTTVEELAESRVRLEVEVPEDAVRHAFEHAAHDLAGSVKIPGFRKGKVPMPVILSRLGRDTVWREAVEGHVEGWFWMAASASGIRPVADPEIQLGDTPAEGGVFNFTATVSVLPKPELGDWRTLEVGAAEPEVPAEFVDAELDALRSAVAELTPVNHPARLGDTVVLDLDFGGGNEQRDYVVELGDERLVDEVEQALVGMSAGETKTVRLELEDGSTRDLSVTVKDVKEKILPAVDDELARAATEFDTLADLRADIESRLKELMGEELEGRFREDAVDALVGSSNVVGAEPLVERRAQELAAGLVRSLERRGISVGAYLATTGQTQEQVMTRLRAEADTAVKRELVLAAVADQEGIEVADEEIEEIVRGQAAEAGDDPEEAIASLRAHGAWEAIRGDLRLRRAADKVVAEVKRIPVDLARAREKLWIPGKEKGGTGVNIWTPGSEERGTRG